jgi:hypothetical protein
MLDHGNTSLPLFLNYGGADKSVFDMNIEEFEQAAQDIRKRAMEKAFSKGLPIYNSKGGKVVAEYADGHVEVVES